MSEFTEILKAIETGEDPKAADRLLPLVYSALRDLAASHLAKEKPGHTLQPTALVHEAYLRLIDGSDVDHWNSRGHFFGAAAKAIRRILIENARRKNSLKRGGGLVRQTLEEDLPIELPEPHEDLLALDEALTKLARINQEAVDLVQLIYFAGLTQLEAAKALGIGERTVRRHWSFARAWLRREIAGDPPTSENS